VQVRLGAGLVEHARELRRHEQAVVVGRTDTGSAAYPSGSTVR
jgi:hypothetical protein